MHLIYIADQITAGGHLRMFSADAGTSGVSGDMSFGTGVATSRFEFNHDGHSGAISMTTGSTRGIGRGGDISLRVGTENMADGGDIFITAGNATGDTFIGGSLNLHSGSSDYISGDVSIMSPGSGEKSSGYSGNINIDTGSSFHRNSGALRMGTGDGEQASSIFIQAGKSTGMDTPGGGVLIQGGAGSSSETYYGGDGGDIQLIGGLSSGNHILNDRAGNVLLEGGESAGNGIGGSIKLKSGRGSISGVLKWATSDANCMKQGSGPIHINSGQVSSGVSGNLVLETGSASLDKGGSGTIKIQSGTSGDERGHRGYNPYSYRDLSNNEGGAIELISGTKYDGIRRDTQLDSWRWLGSRWQPQHNCRHQAL